MPDLRGQAGRVVLDCPQPAGWSTGVDAKTADVSEAGHEATGPSEAISLGLPTWVFNPLPTLFWVTQNRIWRGAALALRGPGDRS